MKTCKVCQAVKPLAEFNRDAKSKDGTHGKCRPCNITYMKAYHAANPTKNRELSYRKYGITLAEYDQMVDNQDARCAICGTTDPGGRGNRLAVDHCHTTGAVRSLLCGSCNTALGLLGESVDRLASCINYLQIHNSAATAANTRPTGAEMEYTNA